MWNHIAARTEADGVRDTNAPTSAVLLHRTYGFGLAFKGLLGLSQLAAGLALVLTPSGALAGMADALIRAELAEDPGDPLAQWAMHAMAATPLGEGSFYAVYLCIHGMLNLGLVLALVARLHWAFPASILALIGFVAYQGYKYSVSGGAMMIILSVIDIFVIWLIWREYRLVLRQDAAQSG